MQGKTVNQVIASNVRRAMEEPRGGERWTYDQLARGLARYGVHQTRQNLNKKVRSEAGKEAAFTANELLAFSLVFERPLVWFLLPQPHHTVVGPGEDASAIPAASYLDHLFADPHSDVARRLEQLGASEALQDQRALHDHYVGAELGDLFAVEETLRKLADRFSAAAAATHDKLVSAYTAGANGPTYQEVAAKEEES
jgi:hypothetical protein